MSALPLLHQSSVSVSQTVVGCKLSLYLVPGLSQFHVHHICKAPWGSTVLRSSSSVSVSSTPLPQHPIFTMSIPDLCLASPNATPFIITVQDAILLESSEGFSILRQHLAETCIHGFCEEHSVESAEDQQAWISMRDILHALLAPIVALQDHATSVAQRFTGATTPEGLEFAFQGVGRNAFVWLQSFLSTDADWCLSNDCPGIHNTDAPVCRATLTYSSLHHSTSTGRRISNSSDPGIMPPIRV